jgi:hypothetical protein
MYIYEYATKPLTTFSQGMISCKTNGGWRENPLNPYM